MALLTGAAINLARFQQSVLASSSSNITALQAYQYAESKADIIKATKYKLLAAQAKTDITGSNYQDEVLISEESSVNDHLERTATVNVFLKGETKPRASVKLIRASVEKSDIPEGSIIPWYGSLSEIPEGWYLCNGSNGTPDLRDRFIVGAGNAYKLGDIGGLDVVKLEASEQPNHYHFFGWNSSNNTGYFLSFGNAKYWPALANGVHAQKWNGSNGGNWSQSRTGENLATSLAVGTAAAEAHENRPPYYALYYIMKKDS